MKLYKGRIPDDPNPLMEKINRSLPFDIRLLPYDLRTNRAWATELTRLGVFDEQEYGAVEDVLDEIAAHHRQGGFDTLPEDEDVHTLVERLLTERLEATGARIHTGRSRNDQVVCDLRLYAVDAVAVIQDAVLALIEALRDRAEEHAATLLAGTTHMQPALPITLGHYLLSLVEALMRDYGRLDQARKRTNHCPLGAGAMAGSGFPVDRHALARELGFTGVLNNSIDAVSDRDFCLEIAAANTMLVTHLSRYADQMIVWANPAFGYVRFSDDWSTGSSMMPQKRNPDAMELVRGKSARVLGQFTALVSLLKGVPLSYAKDLQEDKEALFDSLDTTLLVARVFKEAIASATFNEDRLRSALTGDMLATDIADALARQGVPFRDAHERVGAWVSELEEKGRSLLEARPQELSNRFSEFGSEPPELTYEASVNQRSVTGGTAPVRVREQISLINRFLADKRS